MTTSRKATTPPATPPESTDPATADPDVTTAPASTVDEPTGDDPVEATIVAPEVTEQVGETFVVVSEKISLHIGAGKDGNRPERVRLGSGREVDVVDEHVTLLRGETFGASNVDELLQFRTLVGVGYLRAAQAAGSQPIRPLAAN